MEAASGERIRKVARASKRKHRNTLDARLWGTLQNHILLEKIYQKLSQQNLFRLRLVCKDWYHATLQRLESKPYFVIMSYGYDDERYLTAILTYDDACEKFSFNRLNSPALLKKDDKQPPFEVEGLIFCHHPDNKEQQGVFSIHTRTWHAIPPVPIESKFGSVFGMMVDTSQRPYSFKLVVGSAHVVTQIYDSQSRTWRKTTSRLPRSVESALRNDDPTCMCNDGYIYISIGAEILLMYRVEGDAWTVLDDFSEATHDPNSGGATYGLGIWEGRTFTVRDDFENSNIAVWELKDLTKREWVQYAVMPEDEYEAFMECAYAFVTQGPSIYEELRVEHVFCNGYLLVYNWQCGNGQAELLVMLNLATKEWQRVDLPPGTVSISKHLGDCHGNHYDEMNGCQPAKPPSVVESTSKIVPEPTFDKFECAMCGFESKNLEDYESHKKSKVHRVLQELRKDKNRRHSTPLSLLHEYTANNHCRVDFKIKPVINGLHEVIAIIGGSSNDTTTPATKGFLATRKKRAKQMAAADALEKIMDNDQVLRFVNLVKRHFVDHDGSSSDAGRKNLVGNGGGGHRGCRNVGIHNNIGGNGGNHPNNPNNTHGPPNTKFLGNRLDGFARQGGTCHNTSLQGGWDATSSHAKNGSHVGGRGGSSQEYK